MPTRKTEPEVRTLCTLLVEIISHRSSPFELIACAGELVAADARFSDWFLHTVKKRATTEQGIELLRIGDHHDRLVVAAWREYVAHGYRDPEHLCQVLSDASSRWNQLIAETTFDTPEKK